ncbi:MAG: radical SAM protein [Proteobacteria bacterium]|nr:radical SAM protein [Pseudomonadota bacterium]
MFGKVGYQTMTGRGCPHSCSYCGNSFYRGLYPKQRFVRHRSVEHVISELESVKAHYPFLDFFWFSDDSFFGRPLPDLLHFCVEYKRRIAAPFYVLGSPATITEEKYAALVDAGLLCIQMGIEHGSERMRRLFNRPMKTERILKTAGIIAKYAHRTAPPQYDLLCDIPYETRQDQLETLRLVSQLPKPYRLQVFSVVFYPGTSLYAAALADNLIVDEKSQIYDHMFSVRRDSYENTLLSLSRSGQFPHPLLKLLIHPAAVDLAHSRASRPLSKLVKTGLSGARKWRRWKRQRRKRQT